MSSIAVTASDFEIALSPEPEESLPISKGARIAGNLELFNEHYDKLKNQGDASFWLDMTAQDYSELASGLDNLASAATLVEIGTFVDRLFKKVPPTSTVNADLSGYTTAVIEDVVDFRFRTLVEELNGVPRRPVSSGALDLALFAVRPTFIPDLGTIRSALTDAMTELSMMKIRLAQVPTLLPGLTRQLLIGSDA